MRVREVGKLDLYPWYKGWLLNLNNLGYFRTYSLFLEKVR